MGLRVLVILAVVVTAGLGALAVKGKLDARSDDRLFERMRSDEILSFMPPQSDEVERNTTPPCEGDSATGPLVTAYFTSELERKELLNTYREELVRLGWRDLQVSDIELNAERASGDYRMWVSVWYEQFDGTDFTVTVGADPRQDCLLPIL